MLWERSDAARHAGAAAAGYAAMQHRKNVTGVHESVNSPANHGQLAICIIFNALWESLCRTGVCDAAFAKLRNCQ
jgi:hypothetical protein